MTSEERCRVCMLVLLAIFKAGTLVIGYKFSLNVCHVQFDRLEESLIIGTSAQAVPPK